MKVYNFPAPHKVEEAKQEYRKQVPAPDNKLKDLIAEHSAKVDWIVQRMSFVSRQMDLIGPSGANELWRLQRDLEYYAAKLYDARRLQEG